MVTTQKKPIIFATGTLVRVNKKVLIELSRRQEDGEEN